MHFSAQTSVFLPSMRLETRVLRSLNRPHLKQDIMDSARGVSMMDPDAFLTYRKPLSESVLVVAGVVIGVDFTRAYSLHGLPTVTIKLVLGGVVQQTLARMKVPVLMAP